MRLFAPILVAMLLALPPIASAQDTGTLLLRFPDISATQVSFVHGGDIYVAPRNGGRATRLTSHSGEELFPKFSPDGRWIAFSAEYTGTRQVWVMPSAGGQPRQLTYRSDVGVMPPRGGSDYRVLDWTPDGTNVLVRMNRVPWGQRGGRPYLVPAAGGMETPLAVPETGGGSLSPDGTKYVYTPMDREFRTWKRYRGGRAQEVWIYDLSANTSVQLTDNPATDNQPAWIGDRIYFSSDREYTLNLYSMPATGGEAQKVTEFTDYDVLWPSGGPDGVVFENGGALWLHQPSSGSTQRLSISISDDRPAAMPRFVKAAAQVQSFDIAPNAERALFAARGELFTVPAKHGVPRNISNTPNAREISAALSSDGQQIAYLSDASGEYELYVRASDGSGTPRKLTSDGDIWRFPPVWSPDGKRLAYADKKLRLRYVDVASGSTVEVDQTDTGNEITVYVWSPDSKALAYVLTNAAGIGQVWLYDTVSKRKYAATEADYNAANPAFDPKGRYLYFTSDRDFNLEFEAVEFDYIYVRAQKLFAAALRADVEPAVKPLSDEIKAPKADGKEDKDEEAADLGIDFDGLIERTVALKVPGGNYGGLLASASGLYYQSAGAQGTPPALQFYKLAEHKSDLVAAGVNGYALSGNGKKLLLAQAGNSYVLADAKWKTDLKAKLDMDKMQLRVDPQAEWAQMFRDGWRILRDWFYDAGMHGNDWDAVYQRYLALLPHVSTRADLDYLFSEIAGEMNAGHIYVQSGDQPRPERFAGGLLGAEFAAHSSGYFKFSKVYSGETGMDIYRAPLDTPSTRVRTGEFLIAVDGVDARSVKNAFALLENKADRQIEVLVNDRPSADGARTLLVQTVASETQLRYLDWIDSRRALVDELSGGRIGYVHLPNTAGDGNRELVRQLLPQIDKDALIFDERYNGGGFIPDRMIEMIARTPLHYWKRRGLEPQASPFISHAGPKAMLINGQSSSGGDALPYYFRKLGLGPLIGTRTWGGLIGISGNPGLADGGQLLASTFRFLDNDGNWAVENEGVSPDIEVVDAPHLVAAGRDPSVEKAVEVLLAELAKGTPQAPVAPPAPSDFR